MAQYHAVDAKKDDEHLFFFADGLTLNFLGEGDHWFSTYMTVISFQVSIGWSISHQQSLYPSQE
jgi:hypothetical protein